MASIGEAAASGDRLKALEAIRDQLGRTLEDAEPHLVAGLTKELRAVLADIAALPKAREGSGLDELTTRRKDRMRTAHPAAPPGGLKRRPRGGAAG